MRGGRRAPAGSPRRLEAPGGRSGTPPPRPPWGRISRRGERGHRGAVGAEAAPGAGAVPWGWVTLPQGWVWEGARPSQRGGGARSRAPNKGRLVVPVPAKPQRSGGAGEAIPAHLRAEPTRGCPCRLPPPCPARRGSVSRLFAWAGESVLRDYSAPASFLLGGPERPQRLGTPF